MYYVYIPFSPKLNAFYKGQTNNLQQRLIRHNQGNEKFTRTGRPWTLVWATTKETRSEALKLERKLKNLSQKKTIEFIKKYPPVAGPDGLPLA